LKTINLVESARQVLKKIQPASVRAVCYQLFTLGLIASMRKSETNKVSRLLTRAREDGIIPWGWIVDETREAEVVSAWDNPTAYADAVKRSYRRDRWQDQPDRIEVWSEKGTIRGTIKPVLEEYGVTLRVMHGYASTTAVQQAAAATAEASKLLTVFYLGDWDPSGLHMSKVDLPRRLVQYDGRVGIIRLALVTEDIKNEDLPSFDASTKTGDPRYRWYVERYGSRCWELDALSPNILRQRLADAIHDRIDLQSWDRSNVAEAAERESLITTISAWPSISRQASKYEDRV
jgi:hypothetical protein